LPIADGALAGVGKKSGLEQAQVVKKRELCDFVRRAGRVPVFVSADGSLSALDGAASTQDLEAN
jgi:hypothetical protein